MHKNREDLTGSIFGNWTVLSVAPDAKNQKSRWYCQCTCGKICVVMTLNLTRGLTSKCISCAGIQRSKHNMSKSNTYSVWIQMIERCHNENHKSYPRYGARGIKVCDRWMHEFSNFLEDMGEAPKGMSIERIDNQRGYSKENCKWETWKNQCRNKENSIRDGDVYNDWKVILKIPNQKKYVLKCINCEFDCIVWSCNVRTRHKHKCEKGYYES